MMSLRGATILEGHPKFPSNVDFVNQLKNDPHWQRTSWLTDFPVFHHHNVVRSIGKRGRNFATNSILYKWYWNDELQRIRGGIYFTRECEGPPGSVHGGAIATAIDNTLGWCSVRLLGFGAVTLNLKIDYRKFIPLNSVVEVEAWCEKGEGKKMYGDPLCA